MAYQTRNEAFQILAGSASFLYPALSVGKSMEECHPLKTGCHIFGLHVTIVIILFFFLSFFLCVATSQIIIVTSVCYVY